MKTYFMTLLASLGIVLSAHAELSTHELEKYLSGIETLKGTFQQYVEGYPPRDGTVVFQRPQKFIWTYGAPDPQRLISTGAALYFIDENSEQITTLPQNIALTKLMFGKEVSFNTDVTQFEGMTRQGGLLQVHIDVKDSETWQRDIDALTLIFKEEPLELTGLTTYDRLGNRVDLFFKTLEVNQPVSTSQFEFTPPQYETTD